MIRLSSLAIAVAGGLALCQAPPTDPLQPAAPPAAPVYILQPGDVVDVRFFFNPELNEQSVQIRPDGNMALQLLGDVKFAGRTVEELSRTLELSYANSLKTPRISIQIRNYAGQKAFVSGEVPRPGIISLATGMTVMSAIGEAGGITIRGNRNRAVLIRKMPDGKPARQEIALFQNGKPTMASVTPLQPFDVVLVPESSVVRVGRWVDQYIRQLSPANMVVGFTYLLQNTGAAAPILPF